MTEENKAILAEIVRRKYEEGGETPFKDKRGIDFMRGVFAAMTSIRPYFDATGIMTDARGDDFLQYAKEVSRTLATLEPRLNSMDWEEYILSQGPKLDGCG